MKAKCPSATTLILAAAFVSGLTSCNKVFYQVYDVKSTNLVEKENSMVFENEDLRIMYNLWSDDGSMGFIVQNATDRDLFIDMTQTFFIFNGAANDYFRNRQFVSSTSYEATLGYSVSQEYLDATGYWPNRYALPTSVGKIAKLLKGSSKSVITKEPEYICVPAKSYKVVDIYRIAPNLVRTCESRRDFPKATANIGSYSESNSPMRFKNRISYSYSKDGRDLKHIENDFYVTNITNYSRKSAVGKVKKDVGCYSRNVQKVAQFKIGGPNKFYKVYKKQSASF